MSNYIEWYYNPDGSNAEGNAIKKEYIVHYIRRAFARHNYVVKNIQTFRTTESFDRDNYPFTIRIHLREEDLVAFKLKDIENGAHVLATLQELVKVAVKSYRSISTWTL